MIDLSSNNLMDRLDFINIKPEYILAEGIDRELIKNKYPKVKDIKTERADLIVGMIEYSEEKDLEKILVNWRKSIKPNGVLLFGLIGFNLDILGLGDYLTELGFVDVVIDEEENVMYGYGQGPKEVSIKPDQIQIRRAN